MQAPPQTLFEKAAQLVMVRLGSNLPPTITAADDRSRVEHLLAKCPVGGLLVFNGRWRETAVALNTLQAKSACPLLVASDIERGLGQQVIGGTRYPHAMAFGAVNDAERAVEAFARATALEARACGVHWAFAPVADVNLHPENPIISTRAFGTEPRRVARLVTAYIRGAHDAGLLTTAKHFPGHGRTATDSHATLPHVTASRAELDAGDLLPFRTAIDAGVDTMMTAHVAYPALDAGNAPATLSAPILRGLLRDEMGFEGVVVSDSLLMEGVHGTHAEPGAQAAALVRAGVDVLLDPSDPLAVVRGLVEAVDAGTLERAELERAFQRVWRLKAHVAGSRGAAAFRADPDSSVVGSHQAAADEIAQQAVTVQGEPSGVLPINPDAPGLLVLRITPRAEKAEAGKSPLGRAVRERFPGAAFRMIDGSFTAADAEALQVDVKAAERVVLALAVEPAAWHQFGLTAPQHRFARAVIDQNPTVVAALGSPHVLDDLPGAAAYLCTYSDEPASQRALIHRLQKG